MQNFRDYYEMLGISKEATPNEIKQAYRKLARQYHPDVNPGDKAAEERFKLLGEAYGVLSDPDKREQYEQYSRYWKQKGFSKGWGKWQRSVKDDYSAFEDFDNFVEQLLKQHKEGSVAQGRGWSRQTARASRATADVQANDRESRSSERASGRTEATTQAARQFARETTREAPRESRRSSYQRQPKPSSRRDAEADLTVPLEKAYVGGRERVRLEDGRSLEVNMPAGMLTGQRIRLKGQGIDGGNLYLRIEVEPHAYFTLQEGDVYCRLPVTPSEAALGGTLSVPTLGGPVNMMIPPGVQPGQRLRLTGKGYPLGPGLFGDQIVEIDVVVPAVLDDEEKALYQELNRIERINPRSDLPV